MALNWASVSPLTCPAFTYTAISLIICSAACRYITLLDTTSRLKLSSSSLIFISKDWCKRDKTCSGCSDGKTTKTSGGLNYCAAGWFVAGMGWVVGAGLARLAVFCSFGGLLFHTGGSTDPSHWSWCYWSCDLGSIRWQCLHSTYRLEHYAMCPSSSPTGNY